MGIIWCIITWFVYTVNVYSFMKNWNHNTSPRFSLTYQVKVGHLSLKKKNLKSCIIFDKIVFGEVLLKKCKPLYSLNGKRYMYVASKITDHRISAAFFWSKHGCWINTTCICYIPYHFCWKKLIDLYWKEPKSTDMWQRKRL